MPHKYIRKYKSKKGNWVYIYEDALKKAQELNDKYGPKVTTTYTAGGRAKKYPEGGYDQKEVRVTRNLIGGRKTGRFETYKSSRFNPSSSDKRVTVWSRNNGTGKKDSARRFAGYDAVRYRMTKTGVRKEYKETGYDTKRTAEINRRNSERRGQGFIGKLGALNDKYGPKFKTKSTHTFLDHGKVYVDEYTRNLIGGATVKVEAYSYDKD